MFSYKTDTWIISLIIIGHMEDKLSGLILISITLKQRNSDEWRTGLGFVSRSRRLANKISIKKVF
jgi:hypothetical protein